MLSKRPPRWIETLIPILSLTVAALASASSLWQSWNAGAVRYDAFNLDIYKQQVDAAAEYVTTIDAWMNQPHEKLLAAESLAEDALAIPDIPVGPPSSEEWKTMKDAIDRFKSSFKDWSDLLDEGSGKREAYIRAFNKVALLFPMAVTAAVAPDYHRINAETEGEERIRRAVLPVFDAIYLRDLQKTKAARIILQREIEVFNRDQASAPKDVNSVILVRLACVMGAAQAAHTVASIVPKACN